MRVASRWGVTGVAVNAELEEEATQGRGQAAVEWAQQRGHSCEVKAACLEASLPGVERGQRLALMSRVAALAPHGERWATTLI